MARYTTHPSATSLLAGGVVAGLIGGALIDAFLFAIHRATFPATYQWIASGIVGSIAFTGTGYVLIGIAIHFAIAVVAALAYAYIGQIVGIIWRPIVGGILLGIVVNAVMDAIVWSKGLGPLPHTTGDIAIGLVAHVFFYGIPVAWFVARFERVPLLYTNRNL